MLSSAQSQLLIKQVVFLKLKLLCILEKTRVDIISDYLCLSKMRSDTVIRTTKTSQACIFEEGLLLPQFLVRISASCISQNRASNSRNLPHHHIFGISVYRRPHTTPYRINFWLYYTFTISKYHDTISTILNGYRCEYCSAPHWVSKARVSLLIRMVRIVSCFNRGGSVINSDYRLLLSHSIDDRWTR